LLFTFKALFTVRDAVGIQSNALCL
jgi:hypothetical protein